MRFEEMTAQKRAEYVAGEISRHKSCEAMKRAAECRAYYETENPDIMRRCKTYAAANESGVPGKYEAVAKENKFAANEKMASSYFRDITDSKTQYLAGEGADVNAVNDDDAETVARIYDPIKRQVKRQGQACLADALVYRSAFAYLQVIGGRLKLTHIPYCEIIPYYDRVNKLEAVIRYYQRGKVTFAEYHTPAMVYHFADFDGGDGMRQTAEVPQIQTVIVYGDGTTEPAGGKGWPRLPWFELQHNNDKTSSLTNSVKTMIRCYDIVSSDFVNNLIDIQDVFVKLKQGYGSGLEYGEQLELMRIFKASEDVEGTQTTEIPYQAREVLLNRLNTSIYKALRGVDLAQIAGSQKTAKEVKAIYSDIDLWADQAEWHLEDWVVSILETVADYLGETLPPVNVTFTRRVMFDETEQMDAIARQFGIISRKTLYENHPLVIDAQEEIERVNAEELDAAYSNGAGFGDSGGNVGFM